MAKKEREPIVSLDTIKRLEGIFNEEHLNYGLTYFSVYVNLLDSHSFKKLIKKYGFVVYALFLEIQKGMLRGGAYYMPHDEVDDFLQYFAFYNKISVDSVYELYQEFLDNNIIQFLDTTEILGFSIITNSYVVYNYDLTNTNKMKERIKSRNRRATEKNIEEVKEEIEKEAKEESEAPEVPEEISDIFGSADGFNW